jgi:glycerol-3-phosphate acyltransferase PlsY
MTAELLTLLVAYLIGSVSFAVVVSRVMGLADPRTYGSGNPGATNVLRTGNRLAALLTLLGDALKGVIAVLLARAAGPALAIDENTVMLAGLAAFMGHLFPVFHRFQGGKGVATAAGVLLAVDPLIGGGTLATWLIIAFFFRYSSLAALVAAVFAPFWQVLLHGADQRAWAVAVMGALLIWRHRVNIGRLLNGTESRIGGSRNRPADSAPGDTDR